MNIVSKEDFLKEEDEYHEKMDENQIDKLHNNTDSEMKDDQLNESQ